MRRIIVVGLLAVCALAVLNLLFGFWYTVDQTELANVRRFGVAQYKTPVGPGLHFKLPIVDEADKIQVTLQTIHVPPFAVLTVDNQQVTIEENFNYTIQPADVYHVMYEVGRPGDTFNIDIENQIVPVAHDRTARIFAAQNMVTVNAEREKIQAAVEHSIITSAEKLFGITAHSLQITRIEPSAAFMKSIDAATMAKNAAIEAENTLRTRQFEAQQKVATATGDANSAIEAARGQAEAVRLNAEANKGRLIAEGEGNRGRLIAEGEGLRQNLEKQMEPFGGVEKFVTYLEAKARLNWKGDYPQVMAGAGTPANLIIPIPGPGGK